MGEGQRMTDPCSTAAHSEPSWRFSSASPAAEAQCGDSGPVLASINMSGLSSIAGRMLKEMIAKPSTSHQLSTLGARGVAPGISSFNLAARITTLTARSWRYECQAELVAVFDVAHSELDREGYYQMFFERMADEVIAETMDPSADPEALRGALYMLMHLRMVAAMFEPDRIVAHDPNRDLFEQMGTEEGRAMLVAYTKNDISFASFLQMAGVSSNGFFHNIARFPSVQAVAEAGVAWLRDEQGIEVQADNKLEEHLRFHMMRQALSLLYLFYTSGPHMQRELIHAQRLAIARGVSDALAVLLGAQVDAEGLYEHLLSVQVVLPEELDREYTPFRSGDDVGDAAGLRDNSYVVLRPPAHSVDAWGAADQTVPAPWLQGLYVAQAWVEGWRGDVDRQVELYIAAGYWLAAAALFKKQGRYDEMTPLLVRRLEDDLRNAEGRIPYQGMMSSFVLRRLKSLVANEEHAQLLTEIYVEHGHVQAAFELLASTKREDRSEVEAYALGLIERYPHAGRDIEKHFERYFGTE